MKRKIFGTEKRPRLSVYRSLKHISVQIINDEEGKTLVAAGTMGMKERGRVKGAKLLGKLIAEKAKAVGIKKVVFDRGRFAYHGRIKAFAEAAKEGGLEF